MSKELVIYVDGACRGNPGPAGIGVVVKENNKTIKEISKAIGDATNNIAEYTALIYALQEALILKAEKVKIITDSELVYRQVIGRYKVKNSTIKYLFDLVVHLSEGFKQLEFKHVLRENNKEADKLASGSINSKQTKMVASLFEISGEESPSSKG